MTDLARMIATKAISPVEVVRAHLERIAALDGELRSYITVCDDAALTAARAAEAQLMTGGSVGPLHGVPYALKDLYDTAGIRTTGGSRILGDRVPAADATVVQRLAAGRRDLPGQAQHGRVRLRSRGAQPALRTRSQPVGPRRSSHGRRLVVGLRRRRRGGAGARVAGLGHRRLDPYPVVSLRHHRPQADLWTGEPCRRAPARLVDGSRRPDDALGRRLRADAARDGGLRRRRRQHQRAAGARLQRRADRRHQGASRGTAPGLLPGRRRAGGARVGGDGRPGAGRRRRRGRRRQPRADATRRRRLAGHRGVGGAGLSRRAAAHARRGSSIPTWRDGCAPAPT